MTDNTVALTEFKIEAMALQHIRRYEGMIDAGKTGNSFIVVDECETLLGIWQSVLSHGCKWSELDNRERREVMDAYDDDKL